MSSDAQFTAKGTAIVGFQTNPDPGDVIERGADVEGSQIGVVARGPVGVETEGTTVGISATSADRGILVRAQSEGIDVEMESPTPGTFGVRTNGGRFGMIANGERTGLLGQAFTSAGIGVQANAAVGIEAKGKTVGGRFIASDKQPQLNLNPHTINPGAHASVQPREFRPQGRELPAHGHLGDLWMTQHPDSPPPQCTLWLCVTADTSSSRAVWAQVLLGTPVEGTTTPDQPEG